jgi:hypothetical protein
MEHNNTESTVVAEKKMSIEEAPLSSETAKSEQDGTEHDEEKYHVHGSKLGFLMAGLCIALFLLGLDTAIVATVSQSKETSLEKKQE